MKYFLPLYLLIYVFAAFFWSSYQVKKRTGINPVTFKGSDSAHDFLGQVFKLLFAIIFGVVVLYSFLPNYYKFVLLIDRLEISSVRWVGVALLMVSLCWTVVAQAQMGESWRIGVDSENKTSLVERGIFRFSRNPIFLGMMTTLFGLLLVIPNAITFLAFVLGVVVIGVQVRLEEDHLTKLHGDLYLNYCRRVRRWF